jgi:hypothetical protein
MARTRTALPSRGDEALGQPGAFACGFRLRASPAAPLQLRRGLFLGPDGAVPH